MIITTEDLIYVIVMIFMLIIGFGMMGFQIKAERITILSGVVVFTILFGTAFYITMNKGSIIL